MLRQLACDVDMDEEAEMRRIEGWGASGSEVAPETIDLTGEGPSTSSTAEELLYRGRSRCRLADRSMVAGDLRLTRSELVWIADCGGAPVVVRVADVAEIKVGKKHDGESERLRRAQLNLMPQKMLIEFSHGDAPLEQDYDERARFRDTLNALRTGGGGVLGTGGGGGGVAKRPRVPAMMPAAGGAGPSEAEREVRERQLASDEALRASYASLVTEGRVLTEDDFWRQRRHMLATQMQREGFSSQRPDVRSAEKASAVKFTVTRQMMQAIFTEYPGVHKAWLEKVPHAMSERVFWQRYFRSKQKRDSAGARDAGAPAAADAAGAGDDTFECGSGTREERLLYPDAAHLAGEEVAAVTHRGSYGLHVDNGGARGDSEARSRDTHEVMANYNKHAGAVLDGTCGAPEVAMRVRADERRDEIRAAWVALPDLLAEAPAALQSLPAIDAAARFGSGAPATMDTPSAERAALVAAVVAELGDASRRPLRSASRADARAVAEGPAAPARGGVEGEGARGQIPAAVEADLREKSERSVELLRHYYACFPLRLHAGADDRAGRLHDAIRSMHADLARYVESLPRDGSSTTAAVMARARPLLSLLHIALEKHAEISRG